MPRPITIEELSAKLVALHETAETIQAKADAEDRELTAEEQTELDDSLTEFASVDAEITRRSNMAAQADRLAASTRQTQPEPLNRGHNAQSPESNAPRVPRISIPESPGSGGFHTLGHFAASVRSACRHGGAVDPRLVANAPTTYGSEGVGADGGFAVPPDFRDRIMEKVLDEDSLLGRTDQLTTSGNSLTMPADETTPWQTSGGIQVYWEGEAAQITQSKIQLKDVTQRLHKLAALVPITEELLEDAPALDGYLNRKVPAKMDFAINMGIIQGSGAGMPLGILNAPCTVSVAKETTVAQAADTVVFENVVKMYNRMYAPSRSRAVWLINQDVEQQLQQMQFDRSATAGAVPAYLPPGGLSVSPYGTLMGRPILPTEACNVLGDKGDIILADLSQYMTVLKSSGVRQDVSIHLWFDYDTTAFRFIFRVAGAPWWAGPIARRSGSNTLSCFVTLDERA